MRHNESRKNTRSELVCVILYDTRPFVFRTWQTRYGLCITSKLDLHLKLLQTHTDTRAHKKWAQPTQSSAETENVPRLFGFWTSRWIWIRYLRVPSPSGSLSSS